MEHITGLYSARTDDLHIRSTPTVMRVQECYYSTNTYQTLRCGADHARRLCAPAHRCRPCDPVSYTHLAGVRARGACLNCCCRVVTLPSQQARASAAVKQGSSYTKSRSSRRTDVDPLLTLPHGPKHCTRLFSTYKIGLTACGTSTCHGRAMFLSALDIASRTPRACRCKEWQHALCE